MIGQVVTGPIEIGWPATLAAIAGSISLIMTVILQVMARAETKHVAAVAREEAASAQRFRDATALVTRQDAERMQRSADAAAMAVRQVKATLAEQNIVTSEKLAENTALTASTAASLDSATRVIDATHALVNSNAGIQLQLTAVVSRRLANLTKDPEDIKAAELAEKLFREHNTRQVTADRQASQQDAADRKKD